MRRTIVGFLLLSLCGCGTMDYFSRKVVARAGDYTLTTERFAEIMADGTIPLQPTLLERWAWLWVQYALYLQRLADGDSLTDSVTVLESMWPEVVTAKIARLHDQAVAEDLNVDSAVVDSAYSAGDMLILDHILIQTGSSLTATQREQRRRNANAIHVRLVGGANWAREVQASDDAETRRFGGRLGFVERGQTEVEFEQAAFGLEPGGLSDVVETRYGFHIIRRPMLNEVHVAFRDRVTESLADRLLEEILNAAFERRGVRMSDESAEIIRDAASRPLRVLALEPGRVIAEFEGGDLTDVEFVQWFQVLPVQEHFSVEGATDEEIEQLVRRVLNNILLRFEVEERGIEISAGEFADVRREHDRQLQSLRSSLSVDSALARATTDEDRKRVGREALDRYMVRITQTQRDIEIVPPLLAAKLRAEDDWSFYYGGLNRAVRLAVELRAARDSTTP